MALLPVFSDDVILGRRDLAGGDVVESCLTPLMNYNIALFNLKNAVLRACFISYA